MKKHTSPLEPETFYHIYNRGNNSETIFKEKRNYSYFLNLYAKYIEPIAGTYTYCLLGNHFHFLIRMKSINEVQLVNDVQNSIDFNFSKYCSNQFAKLFNSYTQSINKAYGRTGSLFENPFRRIAVDNDAYLSQLIAYIHLNPQKHWFVDDFRDYPYSSYSTYLLNKTTRLKKEEVINWFGNKKEYIDFHQEFTYSKKLSDYLIEF